MLGTIIITGANGSLAIPAVEYLIANYPEFDVVLTVRDTSDADTNSRGPGLIVLGNYRPLQKHVIVRSIYSADAGAVSIRVSNLLLTTVRY